MKIRSLTALSACLAACVLLGGCKKAGDTTVSAQQERPDNAVTTQEAPEDDIKPVSQETQEKPEAKLSSLYLTGSWTLFDRKTGRDYGILAIEKDGSFDFTRLSDEAVCSGTVSFDISPSDKGEEPGRFSMDIKDCKDLLPEGYELYGDEGTSGIFHTGTFGNKDYLYLKEIGNGDSVFSMYIFNTKGITDQIGDWSYDWLLRRDDDVADPGYMIKNDTFHAWAWETDDDGVWLQLMEDTQYEAEEDYTGWRYIGGFFYETDDIGIVHYDMTDDTDLSDIVNTHDWDSGYPLMMCEVTTDADGNIDKIRDIDIVMYDSYHMGDIEPEFSYRDTTFIVDGYEMDITPYAPAATAITDAGRVGDWIIVTCHNNPNINTYLFYNIYDGMLDHFEYQTDGANLIWQGDDLSTAVYQYYNDIYDIWGHQIGHIEEGELYGLSFKDANTIDARCWIIDEAGREKEFTEEFEYEPCDGAVWAYFEYLLGGNKKWRHLKEMAADATALIIVDLPEKICGRMSYPVTVENGALDKVVVVPLFDDSVIGIRSYKEEPEKGRSVVFEVTVPEGIPTDTITVDTQGRASSQWEVGQLSGKIPQMSTFIR